MGGKEGPCPICGTKNQWWRFRFLCSEHLNSENLQRLEDAARAKSANAKEDRQKAIAKALKTPAVRAKRKAASTMSFAKAFKVWRASLMSAGFEVDGLLKAPAKPEAIAALEKSVGFALPPDFKALYRLSNGQVRDRSSKVGMGLFGFNELIPLSEVRSNYRMWAKHYGDEEEGDSPSVDVRKGDPVLAKRWHKGWVPFAIDGGGGTLGVDLSPKPGGTYGQVIVFGRVETYRRVLARSISELLALAAAMPLKPILEQMDDGEWVFNMEDLLGQKW